MTTSNAALSNLGAIDAAHHIHPFTDMKKLNAAGTRIIQRAEGSHIFDNHGKKYLDAFAGLWCVNVGYGRKEIADAVYQQMNELPYYNAFFGTTTPPTILLSEKITAHAGNLKHVFFTSSGSEATDTWFRMARIYWSHLGKPTKTHVIARRNGYHGSTVAGASLGGMKYMHEQGALPIEGIHHIGQPYWYVEGGDLTPAEFGLRVAKELEAKIDELGEDNVAAFVAEPIQGAGGVIVPPETYWPEIVRICKARNILLVADEVICGFGRTGSWFGHQHYGFEPDLAPVAKGLSSGYLPIGGVLVSDRVAEVIMSTDGRARPRRHRPLFREGIAGPDGPRHGWRRPIRRPDGRRTDGLRQEDPPALRKARRCRNAGAQQMRRSWPDHARHRRPHARLAAADHHP